MIDIEVEKYESEDYYAYIEGRAKHDFGIEISGHMFLDQKLKEVIG